MRNGLVALKLAKDGDDLQTGLKSPVTSGAPNVHLVGYVEEEKTEIVCDEDPTLIGWSIGIRVRGFLQLSLPSIQLGQDGRSPR